MGKNAKRRRETDPQTVQRLWEAITFIRNQKQVSNADRILRYMKREFAMSDEGVKLLLDHAVGEGLVTLYSSSSSKLSNSTEQDAYILPQITADDGDEGFEKGSNDWYCFRCHRPGEMLECSQCWRSYHQNCVEEKNDDYNPSISSFTCPACQPVDSKRVMSRKMLNHLLTFTVERLKEKSDELHRLGGEEELDELRRQFFVFEYLDLNMMQQRTADTYYDSMEQFETDTRTVLHSALILFGQTGFCADLARQMMGDCERELSEIRMCKDCYRYSYEKPDGWFSIPCDPPHKLVYGRQKGFGFWPCKILRTFEDGNYDVRFFAGHHERAKVQATQVKPIDVPYKSVGIKPSKHLTEALAEVSRHERLLSNGHSSKIYTDDDDIKPQKGRKQLDSPARGRGRPPKDTAKWSEDAPKTAPVRKIKTKTKTSLSSVKKKEIKEESKAWNTTGAENKRGRKRGKKSEEASPESEDDEKDDWSSTPTGGKSGDSLWKSTPKRLKVGTWDLGSPAEVSPKSPKSGRGRKKLATRGAVAESAGKSKKGKESKAARGGLGVKDENGSSAADSMSEHEDEETDTALVKKKKKVVDHKSKSGGRKGKSKARQEQSNNSDLSDHDGLEDDDDFPSRFSRSPAQPVIESSCAVTSSEDGLNNKPPTTPKKIKQIQTKNRGIQAGSGEGRHGSIAAETQTVASGSTCETVCKCKEQYNRERKELETRLEEEHRKNVKAALEELKNTLYDQFEDARRQSFTAVEERHARELEERAGEVESKCRVEYVNIIKRLESEHSAMVAAVKKKQWCYNCGEEAMYHCCWNTSYCSTNCQQEHWQSEHKRVCRRKRKT